MILKYNISFFLILFFVLLSGTWAQPLLLNGINNAEKMIAHIDSSTLKLREKLYPTINIGDENVYGFNEEDIPAYSDNVYEERLKTLETEIPLEYNEHVKSYIDLYAFRKRKLVSKVLTTSRFYFPIFEEILDREKLPIELKYLAVIESALNQNAISPVGAVGLWQFMPATGKMYGLKTNIAFDERREIIKSTEAAVAYLKNSYRIYNDWLLVIASYNCGPGNVNKAIRLSGGKRNFWQIMPYLPKETRGYVPAFIAAAYVMNFYAAHNIFPNIEYEIYPHLDTVMVDNTLSIEKLALALNTTTEDILQYNPALRRKYIPFNNQKTTLTLPYKYAVQVSKLNADDIISKSATEKLNSLNYLAEQKSAKKRKISYTVKKGDVLGSIANKYHVTIAELKKWNKGKIKSNSIKKGQKLNIYPRA